MQDRFSAPTTMQALQFAFGRSTPEYRDRQRVTDQKGRSITMVASPLYWSSWREVWAQLGVRGPDSDLKVRRVKLTFSLLSGMRSPFGVQIRGGDKFIDTYIAGKGTVMVTVTGNVATAIAVRVKTFSVPVDIKVEVS